MRKFMKEQDLKDVAMNAIAPRIVIRSMVNGTSYDEARATTEPERAIIEKIAYGALLALNESEINRSEKNAERASVSGAEYMTKLFIPECNSYDTMYCPLCEALDAWEKEAE